MSDAMHSERLQVPVDEPFQKAEWTLERIGWGLLVTFAVAGLLGLMGHGPLSRASVFPKDRRMTLDYERFLRRHDQSLLRVTLSPTEKTSSEVRLSLNQAYLDAIEVRHIVPEPARVELGDGRQTFVFITAKNYETGVILFHIEADAAGSVQGELGLDSSPLTKFSQFVYP